MILTDLSLWMSTMDILDVEVHEAFNKYGMSRQKNVPFRRPIRLYKQLASEITMKIVSMTLIATTNLATPA